MNRHSIIGAITTALILGGIAINTASANLKAEIRKTPQGPMLYVSGKATAPTVFFVNLEMDPKDQPIRLEEIASAARHGVHILSFPIYMPWKQEGVETSFATTDAAIDAALKADPDALVIPRFGVTWPPQWWVDKHPEEIMLYDDGKRRTASVHSRIWRDEAAENVRALVRHLEEKYGDHMLGYHPTGQHTGEWFYDRVWEGRLGGFEKPARDEFRTYLKGKYGSDVALRRAWHDPDITIDTVEVPTMRERTRCTESSFRDPLTEQKTIDFFEFQNLDMATTVEDMCKAVKAAAPDKLTVMFYGYPFELAALPFGPQTGGHLATAYLMKSPHLDVMCSPVSYQNRGAGGGGFFMAPVDSVQAHTKLWLVEDDTRTHFAEPDAGYGRCADFRETKGVLARNYAHYLTRGAAAWWMDLMGTGWYQGDELWSYLSGLQTNYQNTLPQIKPYRPEIAAIVDERSCLYLRPNRDLSALSLGVFREHWYRIGAPVGIYLMDDLVSGKVPPAKMYIMLNVYSLDADQIAGLRKHACRKGNTVVWMYAPGIVRDGKLESSFVQDAAGILLTSIQATGEVLLETTGDKFSAGHGKLTPMFAVSDKDAHAIARYAEVGEVAVAAKDMGGWTSVYSGLLQLPPSVLRDLARKAGVHIYSDQNDVIAAGNGFVSIHASSAGPKTIHLPQECEAVDAITGASLGRGKSFTFDMMLGDTRLLRALPL